MLSERIFSLSLQGNFNVSYATLGGYDIDQFAVEDLTWHDNISKYFWAVELEYVKLGEKILMAED